jgi:hypothetical protein
MNGCTIHFLFGHRVELFELGILPIFPIGETPKLASGEASEALLLGCPVRRRVERAEQKLSVIIVELFGVDWENDVFGNTR